MKRDAKNLAAVVGRVLAMDRKARGLSQAQLAKQLGRAQGSVSRIENGSLRLEVTLLARWAHALGTTPSDVVTRAETLLAQEGCQCRTG